MINVKTAKYRPHGVFVFFFNFFINIILPKFLIHMIINSKFKQSIEKNIIILLIV